MEGADFDLSPSRKRPRDQDLVLELPADDEVSSAELRALINTVAADLAKSGKIEEADAGLAASYLFRAFASGGSTGLKAGGDKSAKRPKEDMEDEGSWTCASCNNRNYASRLYCNMRSCGKARNGKEQPVHPMIVEAPRPARTQQGTPQGTPPGSWVCSACHNLNYASRTFCNSHKCGQPRPAVDVPVDPATGNWTCPACSNSNYPARTICNRHSCRYVRGGEVKQGSNFAHLDMLQNYQSQPGMLPNFQQGLGPAQDHLGMMPNFTQQGMGQNPQQQGMNFQQQQGMGHNW